MPVWATKELIQMVFYDNILHEKNTINITPVDPSIDRSVVMMINYFSSYPSVGSLSSFNHLLVRV